MIDVHCHLQDPAFDNDLNDVIGRARKGNIKAIITSVINPKELEKALSITKKYENYVFLTIGHNPVLINREVFDVQLSNVEKYSGLIVGIGEVGLDYWYVKNHREREIQRENFSNWIDIAKKLGFPLIVHSRSAGKYAIQILLKKRFYNVIMHAYDGSVGWAIEAAKYGVMFSIPPSIMYSVQKQKLVKRIPLENILLETDSPVLAPIKGERNEPANIIYSAKKIAEIKNISLNKVIEVTTENTLMVFKRLKL